MWNLAFKAKFGDLAKCRTLNILEVLVGLVFYKWIVGMVNDEAWLLGSNQISFHWLKEHTEEEVVLRDNRAAQDWAEDDEGSSNNEPVV